MREDGGSGVEFSRVEGFVGRSAVKILDGINGTRMDLSLTRLNH